MNQVNCLVIDDDADDREIFEIALEATGYSCCLQQADNGIKALKMLNSGENTPEFIFLDLNMPLLSGKNCLQEIRKIEGLKKVPVVIYSTSSYSKDIEETREMGANHFMSKTPNIKRLTEILSDIFAGRQLPYELS